MNVERDWYTRSLSAVPSALNNAFGTYNCLLVYQASIIRSLVHERAFWGTKLNLFCQNYSDKIILVEYFFVIFAVDGINYGQLYQSVLCRGKDSSRIFL